MSSGVTATAQPPQVVTTTVVSGTVPGVTGARVAAYHVQPAGTIGEPVAPDDPAPSFPLPSQSPVAVVQTDASGGFQLTLPDARPVVLQATGGRLAASGFDIAFDSFAMRAGVPRPGSGPVIVTPFTTMATRAALVAMRGGRPAVAALSDSNARLAAFLGLADLTSTSPLGTSADSQTYRAELDGLLAQAKVGGIDPLELIGRLGDDLSDGTFDGKFNGNAIPLVATSGGATTLSPTVMTTGLSAAITAQKTPPSSLTATSGAVAAAPAPYVSPYSVVFTAKHLTDDFTQTPRTTLSFESVNPLFKDWYSLVYWNSDNAGIVSERVWGPTPNLYPAPTVPADQPVGVDDVEWKRQRVLAVAISLIGLEYQHHHIPGWNPPVGWPYWSSVGCGVNGLGVDCSDFSSWNYNFGLGMKLKTGVSEQAAETSFSNDNGSYTAVKLLQATSSSPTDYQTIKNTLKTGDLLYIRGEPYDAPGNHITHVIMWVGSVGQGSTGGVPLIIDSHGAVVKDENGVLIPDGPHLRPFYENSWYHKAFDHAHRYLH